METNKKLQKFLEALDEGTITRDEFLEAFDMFMQVLKEMKTTLDKTVNGVNSELTRSTREQISKITNIQKAVDNLWNTPEGKNMERINELSNEVENKISEVKRLIPEVNLKPLEERLTRSIKFVESKIPQLPKPIEPREIRDKLEMLKGEERLDVSAIKGLEDKISRLEKLIATKGQPSFGGVMGRGKVKSYDISSQLNGVLKTFNIPANISVISVHSTSSPRIFRPITDYTYTGVSLTFTSQISASTTLAAGQTLLVVYEEA